MAYIVNSPTFSGTVTSLGPISLAASQGIVVASGAPGVTTNTLYQIAGTLYFNGNSVGGIGASYSQTIGNGALTSIVVTHGLGTTDINVTVWELGGSKRNVTAAIEIQNTSSTQITLIFATAPATNSLRVDITPLGTSGSYTLTDDTATNATYYPVVATASGGSTLKTSSTKLSYNPSTGNLVSTSHNSVVITPPATTATLTLANNSSLITSGAYSTTLTVTGTTTLTLPTSGTLATTSQIQGVTTVSFASTINLDLTTIPGPVARITLTGTCTINITNGSDGQKVLLELLQNGTGTYVVTLGTGWAYGTDITSYTNTLTASKRDILGLEYNSSLSKAMLIAVAHGY
jgi:hypothetical protein